MFFPHRLHVLSRFLFVRVFMKNCSLTSLLKSLSVAVCSIALLLSNAPAHSQLSAQASSLRPRIVAPVDDSSRVTLADSVSPLANPAFDTGAVPATMKLQGMSIVFSRTPAQQAELEALIAAQQNPSSPLYHQWLTPDQFAARFGVAEADLAAVQSWLQHQGFAVDSIARSRNRIFFSGNAGMVASAFGAPIHYFTSPATASEVASTHFAPASNLSLPAAFADSVLTVSNLSSFRPHSHLKIQRTQPRFTSSFSGSHFLTPGDMATIYDVKPAYSAGLTGSGQSIAVLGQTNIVPSDITNFQTAIGIPNKLPTLVLVPNSGTAAITTGDEAESDLDLEYSSAMAQGAQIYFVYTGNSTTMNVFNSLQYSVDQRIAPVISLSYGDCETDLGQTNYNAIEMILTQATTQGQTVVAAAGDSGSTDCHAITTLTAQQQQALAVDYPASSPNVTGMGGTEFPTADVASGNNTYFTAQNTSMDIVSSALSYIPEMVWNDDAAFLASGSTSPIASGGGGVSAFTHQPSWQTGTIGGAPFPTIGNGFRLIPDISLTASPSNAAFAYCTSDKTAWSTDKTNPSNSQQASCNSGLRDSTTHDLTLAGGTSFDAPIFSGLLAIINQSRNSTGQGNINPTLYTLAQSKYSTVFHDITNGGNQCLAGSTYCSTAGASAYAATTGYDAASGLGSIDFQNLLTAWPTSSMSALASTTTSLSAASSTPAAGATDAITITVAPAVASGTTPTGSVSLVVDGAAPTSIPLVSGVATYTFTAPTASSGAGSHVLVATYSGDAMFAASSGTLVLSVPGAPVTSGTSFTFAATDVTVASGSSANGNLTVTPKAGYTGTVNITVLVPAALTNFCIAGNNPTISGTAAMSVPLTVYTSATTCTSQGLTPLTGQGKGGTQTIRLSSHGSRLSSHGALRSSLNPTTPASPWRRLPIPAALAGTLVLIGLRRRSKLLRASLALGLLLLVSFSGLGLTGCSNNTSTTPVVNTNNTPAGTYIITLNGADSVNANVTATTTFNLIVQ